MGTAMQIFGKQKTDSSVAWPSQFPGGPEIRRLCVPGLRRVCPCRNQSAIYIRLAVSPFCPGSDLAEARAVALHGASVPPILLRFPISFQYTQISDRNLLPYRWGTAPPSQLGGAVPRGIRNGVRLEDVPTQIPVRGDLRQLGFHVFGVHHQAGWRIVRRLEGNLPEELFHDGV